MNAVASALPFRDALFQSAAKSVGDYGNALECQLRALRRHVQDRAIDWEAPIIAGVEEIYSSCYRANWDGHGAQPISIKTLNAAFDLANTLSRQLPPGIPAPDLIPEPDGEVSLSWDLAPDRVFSVSVGEASQLNYAGLLGEGIERHGMEPFVRNSAKSLRVVTVSIEELFERDRAQSSSRT